MEDKDIENRFTHHPPSGDDVAVLHEEARAIVRAMAYQLNELVPEGREKSLAITKLEEALFWVNAGIARLCND